MQISFMQNNSPIQARSTLLNSPSVWIGNEWIVCFYLFSLFLLGSLSHALFCLQVGVVESPPRVFNSPYATATSMEHNPIYRMSEFKVCNLVENAASYFYLTNLFSSLLVFSLFLMSLKPNKLILKQSDKSGIF